MSRPGTIPVYVVSLARRDDRRASIAAQLPKNSDLLFSWEIGGDFDHRDFPQALPKGIKFFPWKIESENPWWNRPLKYGEVACTLNHLACWKHASERQLSNVIILEDDAILTRSLVDIVVQLDVLSELDARWDLLYLGREKLAVDEDFSRQFVKPGFSYCTFGYCLSKWGLEKLLDYQPHQMIMPIDEFLPATFLEHPRNDVRSAICPTLRAYALREDCVREADKNQFGSDTEESSAIEV
ncbi:glycosyltransferase family 25 protein [Bradyrhizobium sp. Ec3.3]|uniref:glycosyltransferase family 25 protein n=1 Tax=Bradyrhizobium sp. Ec3.3 TaxID=189753 RepID=UPI00055584C1|nr:glycosyltransferase family 25 protein [Bradyrhizobium sp. Ec3.3]